MDKQLKSRVQDIAPVELFYSAGCRPRPVNQFGRDGKFIQTHPSKSQACRLTNTNKSSLDACLKGKQQTAGGFQWKYAEDTH